MSKQAIATPHDKYQEGKYRKLLSHKPGAANPGSGPVGVEGVKQGFLEEVALDLRLA